MHYHGHIDSLPDWDHTIYVMNGEAENIPRNLSDIVILKKNPLNNIKFNYTLDEPKMLNRYFIN